ncbi:MAG: protein kinase [Polyangiaceae bacterium]
MLIGGKYLLQKQLGEGAMGVVWSAVNTATGGQVAIKLILRSEPELRARLLREAQACGAIRHKNVVQVYDVGTTDTGDPFLVMELLSGETLAALLARKRRLSPQEASKIARDVARALAAAHAGGIVHRDLKPANIFLHMEPGEDEPVVKVVDFGVSKNLLMSDGLRTVAGGAVGSPMYMSPEQARADRTLDHRADMWSLGVVLYEMLTGERPFVGDAAEVVHSILHDPIPRVGRRVRKLDPDIDRIVAACLVRDATERMADAAELAQELDPHARGLGGMREPLPSLLDSGGYGAYGEGQGSPGYGLTPLVESSPGRGHTDLRPPSSGGALVPKSGGSGGTQLSAAASAAAAMHRSGGWAPAPAPTPDDDEDGATVPIEPGILAARLAHAPPPRASRPAAPQPPAAPPPVDPSWGPAGGGTIPLHPRVSAAPEQTASPTVPLAPTPVSTPPLAPDLMRTAQMDQSIGAHLVSHPPSIPAPSPTAPPARAPEQGDRDRGRSDRRLPACVRRGPCVRPLSWRRPAPRGRLPRPIDTGGASAHAKRTTRHLIDHRLDERHPHHRHGERRHGLFKCAHEHLRAVDELGSIDGARAHGCQAHADQASPRQDIHLPRSDPAADTAQEEVLAVRCWRTPPLQVSGSSER